MAYLMWVLGAVLCLVVVFGAYVRLAPSDPARWHAMPEGVQGDKDFQSGAIRVATAGPEGLVPVARIAEDWPRTRVLAGSADEGMVTYVTRTALWGFPDYTTVELKDGQIRFYARLRFGRSDMGVNRARLEAWLQDL